MSATRASCFSLTIGPSWTSSRNGSPVRRRFAFSASVDDVRPGHVAMDEVAAGSEADLALELERREGAGRGGRVEVGVVEDDERVVAAELERDLLEHARRPAGRRAARRPSIR